MWGGGNPRAHATIPVAVPTCVLVSNTADFSDPPPLEPPRPEDYECCGNGCEPCVFDLHAQAVDRWRGEMKAWRARQAASAEAPAVEAQPTTSVPALCRAPT
jgi:hypothetical protein